MVALEGLARLTVKVSLASTVVSPVSGDSEGLAGFAGGEGEDAGERAPVDAGGRRAVGGRIVHGDRPAGGLRQLDFEGELAAGVALGDRGVIDGNGRNDDRRGRSWPYRS